MIEEELEKEAEDYAKNLLFVFETDIVQKIVRERVRLALIDVLEPREKRIAELEEEVTRLKNENLDIINKYTRFAETDRRTIAELEDVILDLLNNSDENTRLKALNCIYGQKEIKEK